LIAVYDFPIAVTRVLDGDTFEGELRVDLFGVKIVSKKSFRLAGINCPEVHGEEKPLGDRVARYVQGLIDGKTIRVVSDGRDKYGRWLSVVYVGEMNLNDDLLAKGYAKPYDGKHEKPSFEIGGENDAAGATRTE
jgi:micrococcal nuclease